jgi:hypothetical protein
LRGSGNDLFGSEFDISRIIHGSDSYFPSFFASISHSYTGTTFGRSRQFDGTKGNFHRSRRGLTFVLDPSRDLTGSHIVLESSAFDKSQSVVDSESISKSTESGKTDNFEWNDLFGDSDLVVFDCSKQFGGTMIDVSRLDVDTLSQSFSCDLLLSDIWTSMIFSLSTISNSLSVPLIPGVSWIAGFASETWVSEATNFEGSGVWVGSIGLSIAAAAAVLFLLILILIVVAFKRGRRINELGANQDYPVETELAEEHAMFDEAIEEMSEDLSLTGDERIKSNGLSDPNLLNDDFEETGNFTF